TTGIGAFFGPLHSSRSLPSRAPEVAPWPDASAAVRKVVRRISLAQACLPRPVCPKPSVDGSVDGLARPPKELSVSIACEKLAGGGGWRPGAGARNRPPREARDPARQALRPRCEELAARIRRQMPAVVGRRAPKETEARPRGPKPPRWSAE